MTTENEMPNRVLRDHSEECDHDDGWYWEGTQEQRVYQCNQAACPGGKEVPLTEERHRPFIDDGEMMGPGEERRRFVTEWEPV